MCKTLSEHRLISSMFNVVIQTQRQMDHPPVNTVRTAHRVSLYLWVWMTTLNSEEITLCSDSVSGGPSVFQSQWLHWTVKRSLCAQTGVISSLFNVAIETERQMDPPKHCQSIEWSLHCSMFSFSLKGRGTPCVQNTVRTQIDLSNVQCCHSDSKADGPPPSQHCQSTEWSLHCSMLSFRLKGRWTPQSTLSEHRVISSLFNVVIQTHRQVDSPQNTVRAQSDLFTVQCCHSDSKADGPPMCKTLSEHRVISSLFNVVIQTQRKMNPLVNIVWAQSYLFPVQCCHWDSKADGLPKWTQLEHRVISSLFNVVIETQRQMDPTWSTLSEHRVITSLFNVVIQTQRHMDPLCAKHCQSTEWSLHCSMLSFRFKGRWTPPSTLSENRVISSMFNVVIQTQRQMDPFSQHCQSTEWSLHCSMLSFRLKGRWTPYVQNTARAQSYLFTVQCCHWDSKADGHPSQHCQTTELSLHCSMLSFRLKGRWTTVQHCQSTEWSLHCSMLSFRLKGRWTPLVNIVRAQIDLFTV